MTPATEIAQGCRREGSRETWAAVARSGDVCHAGDHVVAALVEA